MKKKTKIEVINLLKERKYSYKELSEITGYHEKSLIRMNKQIRNGNISVEHKNKNRTPHNYINQNIKSNLIKQYKNGEFKSYSEFHKYLNKYSYTFIYKLLSQNVIKNEHKNFKIIKRKTIANNTIQFKNIRYNIIRANIKQHTEVLLHYLDNKQLFIKYNNRKYQLEPIKKVKPRTGLTKYY